MRPEASVDDRDAAALARSLAALKRRGCWLLVTGRATDREHGHACERLLGDDGAGPRRRILVETAGADRVATPAGVDPTATRVAVAGGQVRRTGAAAADAPAEPAGPGAPAERVPRSDPDAVAAACRRQVAAVERALDLEPAELRLCIDSLLPLVEANDHDAVASLVESVGDHVRAARGMGHVHLPVARDADVVERLTPLFDAVVAVRVRGGRVEHRWSVREADVSSGWLEL